MAVYLYLAGCGRLKEVQTTQKGAFPGTGRTNQANDLSFAHLQVDAAQNLKSAKAFMQIVNPYLCHLTASFRSFWTTWTTGK